jgi:ketosteroid isomerase-like protein
MPEKSTTPDLVEFVSRVISVASVRDVTRWVGFFEPDPVWDMSGMGMGTFEGVAAIRAWTEDWWSAYEDYEIQEEEEILDFGHGVAFAVIVQNSRPFDSTGVVRLRYASVNLCLDGMFLRITNYSDIAEGRAAAERLAEQRR